ncbi:MAG: hypothetical protein N2B02_10170, partial [Amylibacter sp.]
MGRTTNSFTLHVFEILMRPLSFVVTVLFFSLCNSAQAITVNSFSNGNSAAFDAGTCVGSALRLNYSLTGVVVDGFATDFVVLRLVDGDGNIIISDAYGSTVPGPEINNDQFVNPIGSNNQSTDVVVAPASRPFKWQIIESVGSLPVSPVGPVLAETTPFDPAAAPHNLASCASLPFAVPGPSESDILASQQSFFTQLIMNHQAYNVISGVSGNLDGLFNGNGLAPYVSDSGFSFQSAGANKWYANRLKMAEAKKQPAALDILANQSRTNQSRNRDVATRVNTASNLMAYQSSNDNASNKTVEKLDAVAQEDIYAADASPADEIGFYSPWNTWIKGS